MSYAPVILGNKVSFKGPQMILLAIFYFLNGIEIKNFACPCPVHSRVVPVLLKESFKYNHVRLKVKQFDETGLFDFFRNLYLYT